MGELSGQRGMDRLSLWQVLNSQGASEERMVNLLKVAIKCINPSPNDNATMSEVAVVAITLKDEEEKYMKESLVIHFLFYMYHKWVPLGGLC